jgi:hypothetical protein
MDFDASRRAGLLVSSNSPFQLVLEPTPDVAITSVAEFITKASVQDKFTAEQTTKITENLTALGERTEAVMILRESLFRLNLLAANRTIDQRSVTNLFSEILKVASFIAQAELGKETSKQERAKADTQQSQTKAKDVDFLESKLSDIRALDIPAERKATMIQELKSPKE